MPTPTPQRQFVIALERARTAWAAADPHQRAAHAACDLYASTPDSMLRVRVPYFGNAYDISHPAGQAFAVSSGREAHPAVTVALLHYLLAADGISPAGQWLTFRELPDGLFYAQAFSGHAEALLAARFGASSASFHEAAAALGGTPLDLADVSYRFQAFPRLPVAVLLWEGDEEIPGQARILFDAHASHYLPTEDLSGVGDWLAHRLTR